MYETIFHKKRVLNNLWKNFNISKLDIELKRQILHDIIISKICKNNIILSPIKKAELVLNLGAGYGTWSHGFSLLNDITCIVNLDIENYYNIFCEKYKYNLFDCFIKSPEPNIYFVPINLKKENINFKHNTADFIYQRDMVTVYTNMEWLNIIKDIFNTLKEGAYAEFVEYDFVIKHDNLINDKFSNKINKYLISNFKNNDYIYDINLIIEIIKNTFNNKINVEKFKLPLYINNVFDDSCINVLISGYEHIKKQIENEFNIDFETFINNIKKEWIINKSYILLYIIYIRK